MALSDAARSGAAIFAGAVQFGVFLMVSEVLYSAYGEGGYSQSANYISDLGANCHVSGACYIPPSALLFDSSIVLLGLLMLVGAFFLHRAFRRNAPTALLCLTAVGAIGVGLFPETTGALHDLFALIAFLFGGLTAIVASGLQKKPLSYLSVLLGAVALTALVLYIAGVYLGLGPGGIQRMIVYPVLLWGVGFGAHLMASQG